MARKKKVEPESTAQVQMAKVTGNRWNSWGSFVNAAGAECKVGLKAGDLFEVVEANEQNIVIEHPALGVYVTVPAAIMELI